MQKALLRERGTGGQKSLVEKYIETLLTPDAYTNLLENKGYRSLIFRSAEQCIAEVQMNPSRCTVLVTDQNMPGMQGTELAAMLREAYPMLPVVIMSGYFSKISPHALDELGQVELLAKPFTTDELLHAVHRAIRPAAKAS